MDFKRTMIEEDHDKKKNYPHRKDCRHIQSEDSNVRLLMLKEEIEMWMCPECEVKAIETAEDEFAIINEGAEPGNGPSATPVNFSPIIEAVKHSVAHHSDEQTAATVAEEVRSAMIVPPTNNVLGSEEYAELLALVDLLGNPSHCDREEVCRRLTNLRRCDRLTGVDMELPGSPRERNNGVYAAICEECSWLGALDIGKTGVRNVSCPKCEGEVTFGHSDS